MNPLITDPTASAAAAQILATGVVATIGRTLQALGARKADAKESADDQQATCELAVHLLGSVLFECKANVERARWMATETAGSGYGPFDFTLSDALMSDLCRVAPSPGLLEHCRSILAALKRIDFFQRAAAQADMRPPDTKDICAPGTRLHRSPQEKLYLRAHGFARDAIEKRLVERFNYLLEVASAIIAEVFKGRDSTNLVPGRIDPKSKIDHSLI